MSTHGKVITDGSAIPNPGMRRIGILVVDEKYKVLKKVYRMIGHGTNNEAELHAVIEGLEQAKELGITDVEVYVDSMLVSEQYNGGYRIRKPKLRELHERIRHLKEEFEFFDLLWHRREDPLAQAADALSRNNMNIEPYLNMV